MSELKGKNPRLLLQERDDALGSHPTIARTGDKRLGNNKIWYDDTNTYIFYTGSVAVSFPTAIATGSKYYINQTNLTSSIVATSRAPQSVDQSMVFNKQYEVFTPFNESINFEQNIKDSVFYTNSDSLELFGKGFTNNIGAKTKITMEYTIAEKTLLSPTTASLYYYNFDLKRYEEIDTAHKMNPHPNYNMWEARLFGPLGNNIASSSFDDVYNPGIYGGGGYDHSIEADSRTVSFIQNNLGRIMALPLTQSVCIDSRFAATSSQYIRLNSFINHPFLLEKMIIELPIAVGPGWTNDITTAWRLLAVSGVMPAYRIDPFDIGGPCVVFSLLNQIDDNTRDIICSGSIIPSGDNISSAFVYTPPQIYNEVFSRGFLGYASPAAVVNSDSNGFFTGSITMNLEANISNGVFSLGFGGPPGGYTANDGTDFLNSFALSINPFGRSMKGIGSPRSYHGKEYSMPQKNQEIVSQLKEYIDETGLDLTGRNAIYGYNIEANVKSPYLLYPNDNLLFCISKYRSIGLNSYITDSVAKYNFNNSYELQNRHDFTINTGSIKINLYGSLIKNEQEYHDTLNQRLDTNAIHEHIHEIHTDQLRLFYPNEFSGSIFSNFITGSNIAVKKVLKDSTNLNRTDKLSNDSVSIQQIPFFEQTSFNDFIELSSNKNTIYDSMVPDFTSIMSRNGVITNTSPTVDEIRFDVNNSSVYAINNWTKEYPFSKFYSSIKRTSKLLTIRNSKIDKMCVMIMENEVDIDPGAGETRYTIYNTFGDFNGNTSTNTNFTSLNYNDLMKVLYGFGDLNTFTSNISGQELNTQLSGTTNFANFRLRKYNHTGNPTPDTCNGSTRYDNIFIGPEIRGWKYGLSNGISTYPKCIYRSDRYGQFADRLEQSQYTKFYDGKNILNSPVQARFVAPNGSTTLPEYTYSSNLSFECTSSYPYIEDKVTNREEPLNLNKIYSKVITSIDDV